MKPRTLPPEVLKLLAGVRDAMIEYLWWLGEPHTLQNVVQRDAALDRMRVELDKLETLLNPELNDHGRVE